MLRLLAHRRAVLLTATAVAVETSRDKLSIYPEQQPEILLLDTPSELERRIGIARSTATASYLDARAQVQGVVSKWIGVEHAVENRVKSLIAADEPLTPGLLYVGVATLTGSILARNRSIAARVFLPPTLLVLSLNHFLPKTTQNVSEYLGSLEDTYFPSLAEKHEIANAHTAMTWELIKDATQSGRAALTNGVEGALVRLEEATGLKLKETLGWGRGVAKAAEGQLTGATTRAVETLKDLNATAVHKVEEAKAVVEEKIADGTALAEQKVEQVDEQHKRLV